jgi:predicted RNA binding protein YcfA (HicA-like mRNA interferase family)
LGKLRVLSGQQVCAILRQHGFVKVRQRSSHVIMQWTDGTATITVPVPDHAFVKIGTLQSIIRQSGVPRKEFE